MSTASNPIGETHELLQMTLEGCLQARKAAEAAHRLVHDPSAENVQQVKRCEEELDTIDRRMNEEVTRIVAAGAAAGSEARELLACLKCVMDLERIGDLLEGFANRLAAVAPRLAPEDVRDLAAMASLIEKMLQESEAALRDRDVNRALAILRADTEVDRLRNLLFIRHIENPEQNVLPEGFHVVFMAQALERAGDHAKNFAEEVVQLSTGRSVRHLLRAQDLPDEVRFVNALRRHGLGR
jgi:phosphate transport system protein